MNAFYPVGAIVVLVGLGLMGTAHLLPADDCTPGYGFDATASDEAARVDFEALSPEARAAFERAVENGSATVDGDAYRIELDGEVVRYAGRNYTTQAHSVGDCGDDSDAFVFIGGQVVALLGCGLVGLGAFGSVLRRYS